MSIIAATDAAIASAADALIRGEIVAFPTETVYGLGANALDAGAVAKVFAAKARPRFNPLIVHVLGRAEAEAYATVNDAARNLMQAFWPGPLSLVLPRREDCAIADLVSAGLYTVALRAPSHEVARALLRAAKIPIAAPSANRSQRVSPTTAAHVEAELGPLPAMILDGGPCPLGLESTVVGVDGHRVTVLRLGALSIAEIEDALGHPVARPDSHDGAVRSPGQMAVHYAPDTPLRLDVTVPEPGEALLAFGPEAPDFSPMINLSWSGDLGEAAANFFAALRELDALGASAIAVMPIPDHGLGEAINDRLRRAAASRSNEAQRMRDAVASGSHAP